MKRSDNKKVSLGEYNFYIYPFGAMRAAKISGELIGFASPLLAALVSLVGGTNDGEAIGSVMDMDTTEAVKYIVPAFNGIKGDDVEKLLRLLLIKYQNIAFDTDEDKVTDWLDENALDMIFIGKLTDMYLLAWEVIKLNFGGFFEKLSNRLGDQDGLLGNALTLINTERSTNRDSAI